jgi:hypothetical protein
VGSEDVKAEVGILCPQSERQSKAQGAALAEPWDNGLPKDPSSRGERQSKAQGAAAAEPWVNGLPKDPSSPGERQSKAQGAAAAEPWDRVSERSPARKAGDRVKRRVQPQRNPGTASAKGPQLAKRATE